MEDSISLRLERDLLTGSWRVQGRSGEEDVDAYFDADDLVSAAEASRQGSEILRRGGERQRFEFDSWSPFRGPTVVQHFAFDVLRARSDGAFDVQLGTDDSRIEGVMDADASFQRAWQLGVRVPVVYLRVFKAGGFEEGSDESD